MREDMREFPEEDLDPLDREIQGAALDYWAAKAALDDADALLRKAMVVGRANGKGPSRMSRLTGLTREWVGQLAPGAKKAE